MATTNFNQKFYPPEDIFNSLPVREQEQLSLVIGSNLILTVLFTIFGIVLFLFKLLLIGAGR